MSAPAVRVPSTNIGHFAWRGVAYDLDGRRSTTFRCELCREVLKELDSNILTALEAHDSQKHGQTQTTADPGGPA